MNFLKYTILIFVMFILFIIISNLTYDSNNTNVDDNKIRIEKSVRYINDSLFLEKKFSGTTISDIKSKTDLAKILIYRMDAFQVGENTDHSWKSKDGILYSIIKYENGCKNVDNNDIKNSSCVIKIDIYPDDEKARDDDSSNILYVAIDGNSDPIKVVN